MRQLNEIERDLEQAVNEHKYAGIRIGTLLLEADEFFGRDGQRPGWTGAANKAPFKEEFKQWAIDKTGLEWSTCTQYMGFARRPETFKQKRNKKAQREKQVQEIGAKAAEIFAPRERSLLSPEDRRERRIAFVVDAAFYLDDDEWDEAHALIIQRRSERRRSQRVAA